MVRDTTKDIEKPKEFVNLLGLFKILLQAIFSPDKDSLLGALSVMTSKQ